MTTIYAADTFNRADGPVGNAESGGTWSASGAASTRAVASNQLTGQSGNGYSGILSVNDGQSDGAIQATFVAGASAGIVFRYTSAKDHWVLSFGANNYIRLFYMNPLSGYSTKADPGAAAAIGDVFRIELTGPSIVVFRNNVQLISLSDATRVSATSYGFLTGGSTTSKYDNFSHSSLTATSVPPPTPPPTATVHRFFNIGGVAVPVS